MIRYLIYQYLSVFNDKLTFVKMLWKSEVRDRLATANRYIYSLYLLYCFTSLYSLASYKHTQTHVTRLPVIKHSLTWLHSIHPLDQASFATGSLTEKNKNLVYKFSKVNTLVQQYQHAGSEIYRQHTGWNAMNDQHVSGKILIGYLTTLFGRLLINSRLYPLHSQIQCICGHCPAIWISG